MKPWQDNYILLAALLVGGVFLMVNFVAILCVYLNWLLGVLK